MPKRKVDTPNNTFSSMGAKKARRDQTTTDPTQKNLSILIGGDLENGSDSDAEENGVLFGKPSFTINEEYARRFEHNKKREELQRLEEKYGRAPEPTSGQGDENSEEDSSSEEDEDDEGFLATEALDAEISATLQAIRNKDPKVYDKEVLFYKPLQEINEEASVKKLEKPMYLRDYHRENLLNGYTVEEGDTAPAPRTFAQEEYDLKNTIVKEMHDAAEDGNSSDDEHGGDSDGGFIIPKTKALVPKGVTPRTIVDPAIADKDPETFLSNFMAARAWVPTDGAKFQAFESDDEEEDERAEMFEAAYNLRFEDPKSSNEVLRSYARDIVAAKSVRREAPTGRRRQREIEHERKEAERRERDEERARLRRLKIEEVEEKFQKIKKAAGLRGKTLQEGEWEKFLEDDWDDERWEAEMNKRFGDDYYVEQELGAEESDTGEANPSKKKKKKPKKPKWEDDIDINDIIPDFEEEEATKGLSYTLSDSEAEDINSEGTLEQPSQRPKSAKELQKEKLAKRKAARLERRKIEDIVDSRMGLAISGKAKQPTRFRYREASPISFGLTAGDILMAPDAALNQFAGLKKMASFRDPEKKRKDKKRLGKKARLREWRRETFGDEQGPKFVVGNAPSVGETTSSKGASVNNNVIEGRKRKRLKRR